MLIVERQGQYALFKEESAELIESKLAFVDVDRALSKDVSGSKLRELRAQLLHGEERCRSALNSGVSPADAERLNFLIAAYTAGSELLTALWQTHQRRD